VPVYPAAEERVIPPRLQVFKVRVFKVRLLRPWLAMCPSCWSRNHSSMIAAYAAAIDHRDSGTCLYHVDNRFYPHRLRQLVDIIARASWNEVNVRPDRHDRDHIWPPLTYDGSEIREERQRAIAIIRALSYTADVTLGLDKDDGDADE